MKEVIPCSDVDPSREGKVHKGKLITGDCVCVLFYVCRGVSLV